MMEKMTSSVFILQLWKNFGNFSMWTFQEWFFENIFVSNRWKASFYFWGWRRFVIEELWERVFEEIPVFWWRILVDTALLVSWLLRYPHREGFLFIVNSSLVQPRILLSTMDKGLDGRNNEVTALIASSHLGNNPFRIADLKGWSDYLYI